MENTQPDTQPESATPYMRNQGLKGVVESLEKEAVVGPTVQIT